MGLSTVSGGGGGGSAIYNDATMVTGLVAALQSLNRLSASIEACKQLSLSLVLLYTQPSVPPAARTPAPAAPAISPAHPSGRVLLLLHAQHRHDLLMLPCEVHVLAWQVL